MTVCPYCESPMAALGAPCPRCGRTAPASGGLGLEIERRGASAQASTASGAYGGGAFEAGGGDLGSALELDLPSKPRPEESGAVPVVAPHNHPDHGLDAERPSGARPVPGLSGTVPAARQHGADAPGPPAATPPKPAPKPAPPPPDPSVLAIARYPEAPKELWEAPIYACAVLYRQVELWRDLEALRRKRSPDVPLYEAALRAHAERPYRIGLAFTAALVAFGTLSFVVRFFVRFGDD